MNAPNIPVEPHTQIFSSDAAVSTEDLPSWLMAPSLSRFRLAKKATDGQMTLQARSSSTDDVRGG